MRPVRLDGRSLTQRMLVEVAHGAQVELDAERAEGRRARGGFPRRTGRARRTHLRRVDRLRQQRRQAARRASAARGASAQHVSLHAQLQDNLIVTHAVCVGEPFAPEVVRAMLCIRINTLLRGHSGIRVETLQALAAMLNAGVVPVVPQLGSVGASGDLAPLSHLAIVLLGGGEAFYQGERVPGGEALDVAGPEAGDAVVQGRPRAQQRHRADAGVRRARAASHGRIARDRGHRRGDDHRCVRRPPRRLRARKCMRCGRIRGRCARRTTCARCSPVRRSPTFAYHLVPTFRTWAPSSWDTPELRDLAFDIALGLGAVRQSPRPREVLHAVPPVPRRQEAPAAGQLFAALRAAGARRGARCGGAGEARVRHRTQFGHRQPAGVPRCAGRSTWRSR